MPAYFVAVRTAIKEPKEMEVYMKKARAAIAGHQFKVLALYGKVRSCDGPMTDGAIIKEFATFEAVKDPVKVAKE